MPEVRVRTRFGRFTIEPDTRRLLRDGEAIHLSPKAFDLLCALIDSRPKVLEKGVLHARIWPDTYVVDANLNVLIGEIRRAIGDKPDKSEFIRTVHGVGFAFCGTAVDVADAHADTSLLCWVVGDERTFQLAEGENVIGRDPRCRVWLDVPGVSRRHARIRIDSANRRVLLEDLGSTNGTFLRGARVRTEESLADGDRIEIGTVDLTVHLWADGSAPETKRIRRKSTRTAAPAPD